RAIAARRGSSPSSSFHLRDVVLGPDSGYVVLTELDPAGRRAFRLFVRHPRLQDGARPVIEGASASDRGVMALTDLQPLRAGRGWALFASGPSTPALDLDSLRVAFVPARPALRTAARARARRD